MDRDCVTEVITFFRIFFAEKVQNQTSDIVRGNEIQNAASICFVDHMGKMGSHRQRIWRFLDA